MIDINEVNYSVDNYEDAKQVFEDIIIHREKMECVFYEYYMTLHKCGPMKAVLKEMLLHPLFKTHKEPKLRRVCTPIPMNQTSMYEYYSQQDKRSSVRLPNNVLEQLKNNEFDMGNIKNNTGYNIGYNIDEDDEEGFKDDDSEPKNIEEEEEEKDVNKWIWRKNNRKENGKDVKKCGWWDKDKYKNKEEDSNDDPAKLLDVEIEQLKNKNDDDDSSNLWILHTYEDDDEDSEENVPGFKETKKKQTYWEYIRQNVHDFLAPTLYRWGE